MGRPRVQPEARRRGVQACTACKSFKRRCDGKQPCGRCSRLHRESHCQYTPAATGTEPPGAGPSMSPLPQQETPAQHSTRVPDTPCSLQRREAIGRPAQQDIDSPTGRMLQSFSGDKREVHHQAYTSFVG